jgi:hypothetical protein
MSGDIWVKVAYSETKKKDDKKITMGINFAH